MKTDQRVSGISSCSTCCQGSARISEIPLPFPRTGALGDHLCIFVGGWLSYHNPLSEHTENQKSLGIYISLKQPLNNDWQVQWYQYPCSLTPDQETVVTCGHCLQRFPAGLSQSYPPASRPPWTLLSAAPLPSPFLSLSTSLLPCWLFFGSLLDSWCSVNPHLKVSF